MKKILKRFVLFLGFLFLVVSIAIITIYNVYVTEELVQTQIVNLFKSAFNRDISLDIKNISLFKGIEIRNLIIYNPTHLDKKIFIRIDKLKIKYNLFALLTLKLKVNEIILINPRINLIYYPQHSIWNYSDFLKKGKRTEEPKKAKSPIKMTLNIKEFFIKNFTLQMQSRQYLLLTGINLYSRLKFKETSLKGIEKLLLNITTSGRKNLILKKYNLKFQFPLDLNVNIDIKTEDEGYARIKYSLKNQLIEFNKKIIRVPDIEFVFDSIINLSKNLLKIKRLKFDINKNTLLNISGNILDIGKIPNINIKSEKNEFDLSNLNELLQIFLNDPYFYISGKFKIAQLLYSSGKMKNTPSFVNIKLNNLNISYPKNKIRLDNCDLKFKVYKKTSGESILSLNIYTEQIKADILEIEDLDVSAGSTIDKNFKPVTAYLSIAETKINDGILNSYIKYNHKYIRGKTVLKDLELNKINQNFSGNVVFSNIITGNLNNINSKVFLKIPDFKFYSATKSNRYSSEDINIKFNVSLNLKRDRIQIYPINLSAGEFLEAVFKSTYYKDSKYLTAKINSIKIDLKKLVNILPTKIKYSLPFENIDGIILTRADILLKNNILESKIFITNDKLMLDNPESGFKIGGFASTLNYKKDSNKSKIIYHFITGQIENKKVVSYTNEKGETLNEIVYQSLTDKMLIDSLLEIKPEILNLRKFNLSIPDLNFLSTLTGRIIKTRKDRQDIEFKYNLDFEPPETVSFLKNSYTEGKLNLAANIYSLHSKKGDIKIEGRLNFDKMNIQLNNITIKEINGYFPFSHILKKREKKVSGLVKRNVLKDLLTLNYPSHRGYNPPPDNLTIKSFKLKNIIVSDIKFDISYSDNFLTINRGFCRVVDGSISINNSYIDLADMKPSNFRYNFNIEVSDIDVTRIKNIKVSEGEDTRIFANAKLKGKGLDLSNIGELYGAFNITHIGKELALKFLNLLDPEGKDKKIELIKDALESGASPELISVEIKYGQLYPKFWFREAPFYKINLLLLPPSPIEIERKPVEPILRSFVKK